MKPKLSRDQKRRKKVARKQKSGSNGYGTLNRHASYDWYQDIEALTNNRGRK